MKTGKSGEARLIEHIEKTFRFPLDSPAARAGGRCTPMLRHVPGRNLVITTDEIVEGTHYLARFATPSTWPEAHPHQFERPGLDGRGETGLLRGRRRPEEKHH